MSDLILTVFDIDDATPLFEVGTAKDHPNPYLARPDELTPSEIDLLNGGGSIGEVTIRIIDPQSGVTRSDRWLTARLGVPVGQVGAGHSQLNGRRALLKTDSGRVLRDGTITRTRLSDSFAGFVFSLRDIRERPREVAVFTSAARRDSNGKITHAPAVFPRGRLGGYGKLPIYDVLVQTTSQSNADRFGYLVSPVAPMRAHYRAATSTIPARLSLTDTEWPSTVNDDTVFPTSLVVTEKMKEVVSRAELDGSTSRFTDVRVLWRSLGTSAWNEVEVSLTIDLQVNPWGLFGVNGNRLVKYIGDDEATVETRDLWVLNRVYLDGAGQTLPAVNEEVEFLVIYVGEPTEVYPLTYEGPTSDFMRSLYDGDLSDRDPRVRYDATAVNALPYKMRARVAEKRDSIRDVEEEVYRAIGYAPAVVDGLVTPVSSKLPGAGELPTITDANAQAIPGWEHGTSEAITEVVVRYKRDYLIPADRDPTAEHAAGDGVASREVVHKAPGPDWAKDLVGDHKHEIDAWVFRALGTNAGGPAEGLTVMDETGAGLAKDRGFSLLDRWLFGGQVSACRLRTADFPNLKPGDWVIDDRSWRPNYVELARGGSVLAQVMSLQSEANAWFDVVLVDAGPSGQPLAKPTLGTLTVDESTNVVTAPLTGVPTGEDASVEYAFSSAEPVGDSSSWTPGGRRTGDGSIPLPPTPAGADTTVWVRARSVGVGKRPSGWTTAKSVAVSGRPVVSDVRVAVDPSDGSVEIAWRPNIDMKGARLHYDVHVIGTAPVLDTTVDADGQAGSHALLAGTVTDGFRVTVEVEPWSGWDGTSVSGASGTRVQASDDRVPENPQPPTVDLLELDTSTRRAAEIQITGTLGEGGRGPMGYSYRVTDRRGTVIPFGQSEQLSAGDGPGTAQISVPRHRIFPRMLTVRVEDADGRTTEETVGIGPQLDIFHAIGGGHGRGERESDRTGRPGLPGRRRNATQQLSDDGVDVLVDPLTRRVGTGLAFPGGLGMDTGEEYAGRAGTGLTNTGVVQLDVPRLRAAADLPAIDTVGGLLVDTEPLAGKPTVFPVATEDDVAALANGATVEDGSSRARLGLAVSTGLVDLDVPRSRSAANLPSISTGAGRLVPTEPVEGGLAYPVDTADTVATLANGATVEAEASAGQNARTQIDTELPTGDTLEGSTRARRKAHDGAGVAARGIIEAARDREGQPGLSGSRRTSQEIVSGDGVDALIQPATGRMGTALAFPGGLTSTNGEDYAGRAGAGLAASTGIVTLDVPLSHAGANIDAVSTLESGRLDPTTPVVGGTAYPVDTADSIDIFPDTGVLAKKDNADGVPDGATKRVTTLNEATGGNRAYATLLAANQINPAAQVQESTVALNIAKGVKHALAFDGQQVTFSPPFETTPVVHAGAGGLYFNPGLNYTAKKLLPKVQALNLDADGFMVSAKLSEDVGGTTLRTATFSGTDANKGFTPEAWDDQYTFQYDVTVNAATSNPDPNLPNAPSSIELGFWTNDGSGWVLRATKTYTNSTLSSVTYNDETLAVVVDGMGLNDDFRITVESTGNLGGSVARDNVTWDEATEPASTLMTEANGASALNFLILAGT